MEIVCEDFQKALTKIKLLRENANIIEETVQKVSGKSFIT